MWRVILIIWAYISAAISSRLAFLPAMLSLTLLLTPVQQRLVHHTNRVFSLKHQLLILIIERHRFLPLEKINIHILYELYLFSDLYEPSNHCCEGFMTLAVYSIYKTLIYSLITKVCKLGKSKIRRVMLNQTPSCVELVVFKCRLTEKTNST